MESNQSSQTAYGSAFARLTEQYQPKETRLFEDVFVKNIFSKYISFLMQFSVIRKAFVLMFNIASPGILGLQLCRTRYIDEILKKAIEDGIEQLVILGAGFDTRPYRISGSNRMKIFEVDLTSIQDKKKKIIKKCLGDLPDNIIYTPIDFNIQTLDEILTARELDFSKPVIFIWEGVTQYITEEAVNNTLKFISKASTGSIVVFTYVLKSVIDGTSNIAGAESLVNLLKNEDVTWTFGLDPSEISDFIKQYKLTLIEDAGSSYYQENYLKPVGRELKVSPIERIVYARII